MQFIGSGVVVHPKGVILTAKHVLDALPAAVEKAKENDDKAVARVFIAGERNLQSDLGGKHSLTMDYMLAPLIEVIGHNTHDLAVARIADTGRSLATLEIDYGISPVEGDPVATCGYPYGIEVHEGKTILSSFLWGWVSAVVPHPDMPPEARAQYLLQLPTNPGNSGGAVFDPDSGKIIGVASRLLTPKGIPTSLSIAEPVHRARQGIEAVLARV